MPSTRAMSTPPPTAIEARVAPERLIAVPMASRTADALALVQSVPRRTDSASVIAGPPRIFSIWPTVTVIPTPAR